MPRVYQHLLLLALADATGYDLVRGDPRRAALLGRQLHDGDDGVPGRELAGSPAIDATLPRPGAGLFYLLRGRRSLLGDVVYL